MPNTIPTVDPKQNLIDGLIFLEESLQTTLTWAGNEVPCVGVTEDIGSRLDYGGFKPYADVKIKVRNSVFPLGVGLPGLKQTIIYKRGPDDASPTKLRVDAITRYWDVAMMLHCNHPDQGA
jgi:hypothetical protein